MNYSGRMPADTSTRRDAADAMRARLVSAAIGQLAEEGMRGLTHRRVEQRAGVSQGLVKYHFGSLDGLIEAVFEQMAELEIGSVMRVDAAQQAAGLATGAMPVEVWQAARASYAALMDRPDLVRARFELYLHAARRPELQDLIRRGRERFIDAVAESLPSADPRAGARMLLALVNGLLLHQLSAPEQAVDELAPAYLIAVGAAALVFPLTSGPDGVT